MGDERAVTMRPLWSWPVAIALAIAAAASAYALFVRDSYAIVLRVERRDVVIVHAPPPSEGSIWFAPSPRRDAGSVRLTTYRMFDVVTYEAPLAEIFTGAELDRGCSLAIYAPREDPRVEWNGLPPAVLAGYVPIREHDVPLVAGRDTCERLEPELRAEVARLDAWLGKPGAGAFEARAGARFPNAPFAVAVVVIVLVLLSLLRAYRVELRVADGTGVVRRMLGPLRREKARFLVSEVKTVRVEARGLGPVLFHRPTIELRGGTRVRLWPIARLGGTRALAERDRAAAAVLRDEDRANPFRD